MTDTTEKPRELVWTPEMVARFWDWQSRYPDVYFAHLFGAGIADRLFPYFAGAKSILDFGCGSGAFMSRLLAGGAKVAGCDVSPKSIAATTARNGAHPNFAGAATAEALIARGAKFDAIVATETIEHVYDDQLDGILDMMKRLAAPGAKLAFTTPNRENLEESMVYCPASDVVFHRWQHVRSWSTESLGEYMRARGFLVVDMVETDLSVGRGRYAVHRVLNLLRGRPPAKPHLLGVFQTQT
jgi:2-polyprenyl-3-methyl-5-hydroxy-6-metoxy-1,4-benzoquinol methylase